MPIRLALNDEIVAWAIRRGARSAAQRDWERAARWYHVAAVTADRFVPSQLTLDTLEAALTEIAGSTMTAQVAPSATRKRWLHVMSSAHAVGGHTALVARWVGLDPRGDQHHLVLTCAGGLNVPDLERVVAESGGSIVALGGDASFMGRAAKLRELANTLADVVVLHIHAWDVLPSIAFGVSGGAPVLFLNHTDHAFWVGIGCSDAVIALRPSGEECARLYRGPASQLRLPVPLDPPVTSVAEMADRRRSTRADLGIPEAAPVLLTIGSEFKYEPVEGASFFEAARAILLQRLDAYLVAVGPRAHALRWAALRQEFGSRVIAVGPQKDLIGYHAIADVYCEGFPFGSLTALLETAFNGVPPVRAPLSCPAPFTSDGEALDGFPQPATLDTYVSECVRFLDDAPARIAAGRRVAAQIRDVHVPEAWRKQLTAMLGQVPSQHEVRAPGVHRAPPTALMERWAAFQAVGSKTEPVWFARGLAESLDLTPIADKQVGAFLENRAAYGALYPHGGIARLYSWPAAALTTMMRRARARRS